MRRSCQYGAAQRRTARLTCSDHTQATLRPHCGHTQSERRTNGHVDAQAAVLLAALAAVRRVVVLGGAPDSMELSGGAQHACRAAATHRPHFGHTQALRCTNPPRARPGTAVAPWFRPRRSLSDAQWPLSPPQPVWSSAAPRGAPAVLWPHVGHTSATRTRCDARIRSADGQDGSRSFGRWSLSDAQWPLSPPQPVESRTAAQGAPAVLRPHIGHTAATRGGHTQSETDERAREMQPQQLFRPHWPLPGA